MKRTSLLLLISFGLAAAALATVQQARAALGENINAIPPGGHTLSAVQSAATVSGSYSVRELSSEANSVREYVSPSGIVFGIAWNGPVTPDLTALLGSYAEDYRKALSQTPRLPGRRHIQVKSDRVIVERWGHMRNLQGRAYAPDLIPQGVSIDEIK